MYFLGLKMLADEILQLFYEAGAQADKIDLKTYSAVVIKEKMQEIKDKKIAAAQVKIETFRREFPAELKRVTKKFNDEVTPNVPNDAAFYAKMQLWLDVHSRGSLKDVKDKYLTALGLQDNEMLYFVELVYYPTKDNDPNVREALMSLIADARKDRISDGTKKELSDLQTLNRFHEVSLKFEKYPNWESIRHLHHTLSKQPPGSVRALFGAMN